MSVCFWIEGNVEMRIAKGRIENGRVVLCEPVTWPEGTELFVEAIDDQVDVGMREQDWPTDPKGIAELLARWEKIEPLLITPAEEADTAAWREKVKQYTIANMHREIEDLFE